MVLIPNIRVKVDAGAGVILLPIIRKPDLLGVRTHYLDWGWENRSLAFPTGQRVRPVHMLETFSSSRS